MKKEKEPKKASKSEDFEYVTYKGDQKSKWIQPIRKDYALMCTDCGCVTVWDFRVSKGRAQFRGRKDSRITARVRRAMRKKLRIGDRHA